MAWFGPVHSALAMNGRIAPQYQISRQCVIKPVGLALTHFYTYVLFLIRYNYQIVTYNFMLLCGHFIHQTTGCHIQQSKKKNTKHNARTSFARVKPKYTNEIMCRHFMQHTEWVKIGTRFVHIYIQIIHWIFFQMHSPHWHQLDACICVEFIDFIQFFILPPSISLKILLKKFQIDWRKMRTFLLCSDLNFLSSISIRLNKIKIFSFSSTDLGCLKDNSIRLNFAISRLGFSLYQCQ